MNWLQQILKVILDFINRNAVKPPIIVIPDPPTEPPPDPPPSSIAVTRVTPFRQTPKLSKERFREITKGYPLEAESDAIHSAVAGRSLPLAQSWMESRYGQDESARATHNPLGLLWYPGMTPVMPVDSSNSHGVPLIIFPSWAAAFAEWARRMDDPTYKGGVYMPSLISMKQFIYTYVGGPNCWKTDGAACANGETKTNVENYLNQTLDRINRYTGEPSSPNPSPPNSPKPGLKKYSVAGLAEPISLPLPAGTGFRQHLTPYGGNRSGKQLNWTGVTQHTTNNKDGMDAEHHAQWQENGTPGNPGIGVHFYVDDKEVVQTIPVNEQGVHSGDWRNGQHVAVELCVRANGQTASPRAEANSIALMAGLLNHLGKTGTEAMHPHTKNADGHCPRLSVSWSEWEQRVDTTIGEMS